MIRPGTNRPAKIRAKDAANVPGRARGTALATLAIALSLLVGGPFSAALSAQRVYSELTDEAQIRTFTEVSEGLICQCGCRMVLSTCPHVECPWGIPARRFIENRIREGMTAQAILLGFENGFGPKIDSDPVVQGLLAAGREDFVRNLREGFGAHVRARTGHTVPALIVAAFSALMVWLGLHWWRRNRRDRSAGAGRTRKDSEVAGSGEGLEADVRSKLEDIDR